MYEKIINTLSDLEYNFEQDNFLKVPCQASNGLKINVNISEPAEFAEHNILEFWAIADLLSAEEALTAEHYEELLKENFTWPLGSWMFRPLEKNLALCFSIKIISKTDNFDPQQVQLALNGVTHVTASMREDMGFTE